MPLSTGGLILHVNKLNIDTALAVRPVILTQVSPPNQCEISGVIGWSVQDEICCDWLITSNNLCVVIS